MYEQGSGKIPNSALTRNVAKLQQQLNRVGTIHDELADMKAAHDSDEKIHHQTHDCNQTVCNLMMSALLSSPSRPSLKRLRPQEVCRADWGSQQIATWHEYCAQSIEMCSVCSDPS